MLVNNFALSLSDGGNVDLIKDSENSDKKRPPPYWYYILSKNGYSYNSLWDYLKYKSKEDCVNAAEKKVDELVKSGN